jgi:hypothetical protein
VAGSNTNDRHPTALSARTERSPESDDIALADQIHGLHSICPWLEFGRVPVDGTEDRLGACRLVGGSSKSLVMPPDWRFETSLSAKSTFVANENLKSQVQYLRTQGNLDVYKNIETGEEMIVGRTAKA